MFFTLLSLVITGSQNQCLTDFLCSVWEQNEVRDYLMIFSMLAKSDEVLGERCFSVWEKFSLPQVTIFSDPAL